MGVDLEADSMHCFKEKICLIQIADRQQCYIIDPLCISDFSTFKQLMETPQITKVFHGADFDIRSLDRDFGIHVNTLFDTEIACRFLGFRERGLAVLLKKYFQVHIDKKFQKCNWARRPLEADMIAYSAADVAYLIELADILKAALDDIGRYEWALEEFEIQTRVRYENNHEPPLFKRFKGAGKLDARSLAVLENLLCLRMKVAEKKDIPLFKVFGADAIIKMVETRPDTLNWLSNCGALSKKQCEMYGRDCVDAVIKGLALDRKVLPVYPKNSAPRMSKKDQERVKALKKLRDKKSQALGLEPGFLFNNASITTAALTRPSSVEELSQLDAVRNWQVQIIGNDIINTLKA